MTCGMYVEHACDMWSMHITCGTHYIMHSDIDFVSAYVCACVYIGVLLVMKRMILRNLLKSRIMELILKNFLSSLVKLILYSMVLLEW